MLTKTDAEASLARLTRRQHQVGMLKAKGFSAREIADLLCRSRSTVKTLLNQAFKRLEIGSSDELARLYRQAQLIEGEGDRHEPA